MEQGPRTSFTRVRPRPIYGLPPSRSHLRFAPAEAGGGASMVDLVGPFLPPPPEAKLL
jgi:hypothetical protein